MFLLRWKSQELVSILIVLLFLGLRPCQYVPISFLGLFSSVYYLLFSVVCDRKRHISCHIIDFLFVYSIFPLSYLNLAIYGHSLFGWKSIVFILLPIKCSDGFTPVARNMSACCNILFASFSPLSVAPLAWGKLGLAIVSINAYCNAKPLESALLDCFVLSVTISSEIVTENVI